MSLIQTVPLGGADMPEDMLVGEIATAAEVEEAMEIIRPVNRANVKLLEEYDEEEVLWGVWKRTIDGVKKQINVYKKTIIIEQNFSTGRTNIPHNISNIGIILGHEGSLAYGSALTQNPLPCAHTIQDFSALIGDINATNVALMLGTSYTGQYQVKRVIFTLKYTKTTDTWQPVS